jgi:hypothetical protein
MKPQFPLGFCRPLGVLMVATPLLAASVANAQAEPPAPPAEGAQGPGESPPPAQAAPAPAAPAAPAAAPEEAKHWYDKISLSAMVDMYGSLNFNFPKPQRGANLFRSNDYHNGFSLAWAGFDVSYAPEPVGATMTLRFGPMAELLLGGDANPGGIQNVRQAFISWKPAPILTLDFGKWDTFVGGEASDGRWDMTYTRGIVFWLNQPGFHTGLRASLTPSDVFSTTLFVANGWNNTIDNNVGKTFGAQVGFTPGPIGSVKLGYIVGPEQPDIGTKTINTPDGPQEVPANRGSNNTRLRHLIDLVASMNPTPSLSLLLNADFNMEEVATSITPKGTETETFAWYGAMLSARYAFTDSFALALRGEFEKDSDNYFTAATDENGSTTDASGEPLDITLITGTLTFEVKPVSNLIFRLDGRVDKANKKIYAKEVSDKTDIMPTVTLGVIAHTN